MAGGGWNLTRDAVRQEAALTRYLGRQPLVVGECHLRGLMLDGRRKSIQSMAGRLPDGDMQAAQQFVSRPPWEWRPVRRRIAEYSVQTVTPEV